MSMIRVYVLLLGGSILLTCCCIGGCFPQKPTTKDVVGIWVERQDRAILKGSGPCGYFEFFDSGRFTAFDIPREYFSPYAPFPFKSITRMNASGKWELDNSSDNLFAVHKVTLEFAEMEGKQTGWDTFMNFTIPAGATLLVWRGDPSDRVLFIKQNRPGCEK